MKRALAFAAALFSAAGMAKAQPGPFGLDWSMTPSEVRHLENFKLYDAEDDKIIMTRTAPADVDQDLHLTMSDEGIETLESYIDCSGDIEKCLRFYTDADTRIRETHGGHIASPSLAVGMALGARIAGVDTPGGKAPPRMWQRNGHMVMLMMLTTDGENDAIVIETWERTGPTGWEMLGTAVDFWKENAPTVEGAPTNETAPE
ncbi:hypothetical protein [Parvularcula marina]|uniref:hypothetical protein n=1 Tax=Parvularcula marina TaxID=2292771 RepID=UPI003513C87B